MSYRMFKRYEHDKRYDELKAGDVIYWYGAKLRIVEIRSYPYTEELYSHLTSSVVRFDVEPADEEAVELLGNFYSHGTYGGVGCLVVETVPQEGGEH